MRLRMVAAESFRSITANLSTTFAAVVTVLIGMFLLGIFIALGTWVLNWSDEAKKQLLVKAYFCTPVSCPQTGEATSPQMKALRRELEAMTEVKPGGVRFVSKQEALAIMRKRSPALVENLTSNPLPASFEITPTRAEYVSTIAKRLERSLAPGLERVEYGQKFADRVLSVARVIWLIFLVAVVVLVGASTLLIANTIRLSIFARRKEIEVMKLVGATNWFIRGPFMLEGLMCGLFGSLAAVLLLVLGKELAVDSILRNRDWASDVEAMSFTVNALILIAAGLLLGAAGSGLTLRRFLRI